MKTLLFDARSDLIILVHANVEPSDSDWNDYVASAEKAAKEHPCIRMLILSGGAGPNAMQRKKIQEFEGDMRSAVVTSSRVARGIVTAIGWLGAKITAHSPRNIKSAFECLDIEPADQDAVLRRLLEMRLELTNKDPNQVQGLDRTQLEKLLVVSTAS